MGNAQPEVTKLPSGESTKPTTTSTTTTPTTIPVPVAKSTGPYFPMFSEPKEHVWTTCDNCN